jgi:acetyl-CoA carboxylase alpha subunit
MSTYLDFEEPIKILHEEIEKVKEVSGNTEVDMSDKVEELEQKLVI